MMAKRDVTKGEAPPLTSSLLVVGRDFAAGSLGGMTAVIAGHPFDTVKVLVQNGTRFRNSSEAFRYMLKEEGVRGLYRGIGAPLASVAIVNSTFFAVNGQAQKLLHNKEKDGELLPLHKVALAGAVAGGVISVIITPRDLVKSKLQVQERKPPSPSSPRHPLHHQTTYYRGSWDCVRKLYAQAGMRGLYSGLFVTMIRDVPGDMAYFFTYEYVKRTLMKELEKKEGVKPERPPAWVVVTSGGLAGMSFWASIFPLDAIKTRLQAAPVGTYVSAWHCAKQIYAQQGWRAFYRGFSATILRTFPTSGVNFYVFETVRQLLTPWVDGLQQKV
eukprot:TRINITY_DN3557_c0_g1_i4.p1 TRINITY_DN3557_c0_g1~~TRINITY_DN3557_c0_g1_i4.p1  ORF type:complete len:329 (+),score=52.63 TRINITY_DN3557_c0_g1_i4:129-1115(+)